MRRVAFVLLVTVSFLFLLASAASARCIVERFEKVLHDSGAAWWVTVTDAALSGEQEPGYWRLTVHVEHSLKGSPDGTTVTVFAYTCGGVMNDRMKSRVAASLVGKKGFFMGDIRDDGSMVAYSEVLVPRGLTPKEQFQRALDDLGLAARRRACRRSPRRPVPRTVRRPASSGSPSRQSWCSESSPYL